MIMNNFAKNKENPSMQLFIYIFLYPLLILLSVLPFRVLYFISDIFYFLMYYIIGYRKKVVRQNLSIAFPHLNEKERKTIEKNFYKHFTDLFFEMIKAFNMSLHTMQKRFRFINPEILNEISSKGKNIVVVSGHYGNWEWVFPLAQLTTAQPIATYLKINNRFFEKLMLKNRQRFGGKLIETKQLKNELKKYKNSTDKFILGLLADQSPQLHRSRYWRNFFGVEVPVFVGPEKLAKSYDAAFVFMNIKKIKRGFYEVTFDVITVNSKDFENYLLTDIYIEKLEKMILQNPAYYLWTHNRFKHKDRKKEVLHLLDK